MMERFDLNDIGWLTDDVDKDYAKGLRRNKNLAELTEFLEAWEPLAADALAIVKEFDEHEAHRFIAAMKNDSEETPVTDPDHIVILFPDVLFGVSVNRVQLGVPWGAMFRRMEQLGIIVVEDGIARRRKKEEVNG